MKIKLAIIAVILFCSTVHSQSTTDSCRIVKVLTFNILHGATTRGDFDLDAFLFTPIPVSVTASGDIEESREEWFVGGGLSVLFGN